MASISHIVMQPRVFYFGTPVVIVSTLNEDGTTNIAPISSVWWLGQSCMIGIGNSNKTTENLNRTDECVLNLASAQMVAAVDRLALLTGSKTVPNHKMQRGYRYEPDKFPAAELTPFASEVVLPARIAEAPIQMEARVVARHSFGKELHANCSAFELAILRTHVDEDLRVPEKEDYIDPIKWDPLIMKFTEYFGEARNLLPSSLAHGWGMKHGSTGIHQLSHDVVPRKPIR